MLLDSKFLASSIMQIASVCMLTSLVSCVNLHTYDS